MRHPVQCLYAFGAVLAMLAADVSAQSMKPGLWEYQSTVKSQSGEMEAAMAEMQKQMASMPPEQRRQMEQMMAQSGVQMGAGKGGAQVMRMCITPEEAAKLDLQSDPNCKQEITQRSGNTFRIRFSCGGEVPSSGEGTYSFRGDTAFSGKFSMQVRDGGKTERMDMTQEGKWLGANCGSLKPKR